MSSIVPSGSHVVVAVLAVVRLRLVVVLRGRRLPDRWACYQYEPPLRCGVV